MKIQSLKLRGFIGIKKGLGLDEISLDFSHISGLIALSGENGNGKTSVMDCLHPYRQLASRAGALQRHVFLRDSLKELCFEFAGDRYRTLIKIDSDSERTEGFIWKNDTPQVNGKVSEYDKYITGLFGSAQLFFSSVFCAQNAEKISDMTTGELKKLFSEFLRLDRLVEYENTAKQCITLLSAKADGIERDIQLAKASIAGQENLSAVLKANESTLEDSKQLIKSLTNELKELERDLNGLREAAAKNAGIRQRVQDLEAAAGRMEREIESDTASSEKELSDLREKTREIFNEIAAAERLLESKAAVTEATYKLSNIEAALTANAALQAKINGDIALIDSKIKAELNARLGTKDRLSNMIASMTNKMASLQDTVQAIASEISEKKQLLKEKNRIETAVKRVDKLKASMCCVSHTVESIQARIDPMNDSVMELSIDISNAKRQLSEVISDPSIRIMEATINGLYEKMTALDKKDPACTSTTCSFIIGALAAKDDLVDAEAKLKALRIATSTRTKSIQSLVDQKNEELESVKSQLDAAIVQRKAATAKFFRLQAELNECQAVAKTQPQLAIAESRLNDLLQRKSETEAQSEAVRAELQEKTAAAQADIEKRNDEIENLKSQLEGRVKDKQAVEVEEIHLYAEARATKAVAGDQSKIAVAEARLKDLNARKDEAITDGKRIRATWDERIGNKRTELTLAQRDIQNAKDSIDLRADNKVADIQAIIESHRLHLEDETAGMARQEARIASIKKDVEARSETEAKIDALTVGHGRLKNEMAEWLYLKNACSKDGLRALEIDSVAPIISGYANELLINTFGPAYTVKLRTQDEATGKEVLDVLTIREDGSEVNIENLSGGERVWSLKAMRLAMTLISKEKSAKAFTSFFADEEDGALDPENAQNFIGMYRAFMKSGGFDTGFFISHKPECVSMADHVLKFGKDGVSIE